MKNVKAECYKLIQQVVLKLHPYCPVPDCGREAVAGHHAFKRNNMGTAFNPEAVISLCLDHP